MGKKTRILVIAASLAAVLALVFGGVAMADDAEDTTANTTAAVGNGAGNAYGLGYGLGGDGLCSDAVCALLGLTPEEIRAQRLEGLSLVQIAAAQGVTEEELVAVITAEHQARIEAGLADGTLTQERAEYMLQKMEQNIIRAINREGTGRPDWAGTGSNGIGNGQVNKQSRGANGNGVCDGTGSGDCTPTGSAHKYGRASR